MRVALLNTGTELLLGDVQDAHLAFIAREIFPLGLRIEEQRTVPDTEAIGRALGELFPVCDVLFVTGGLGPTNDDITREMVADVARIRTASGSGITQRRSGRGLKSAESNGLRALPVRPMFPRARRFSQTKTGAPRVFI